MPVVYTEEFLLDELRRYKKEFGEVPTRAAFIAAKGYPSDSPYKRIWGSWNDGLRAAGMATNEERNFRPLDEPCCICDTLEAERWNKTDGHWACHKCFNRVYQGQPHPANALNRPFKDCRYICLYLHGNRHLGMYIPSGIYAGINIGILSKDYVYRWFRENELGVK